MAPGLIYGAICHHVATIRVKCGDSDIVGEGPQCTMGGRQQFAIKRLYFAV